MARSLTIQHDEAAASSSLFTLFLLVSVGWLALSAMAGVFAEAPSAVSVEAAQAILIP